MKRAGNFRTTVVWWAVLGTMVLGGAAAKAEIVISEPTNPGQLVNNGLDVQECDISHDGLELYYAADRPGGYGGGCDLWVARRETINDPWQEPVNLGPNVNSLDREIEPSISGDGLELYFASWYDTCVRVCRRASKDAPWSSPVLLVELGEAWRPDISFDGLTLYVESDRDGGIGGADIWVTTRATKADPWGELVNLGPNVNSAVDDYCPCISTDGLTLLFDQGYRSMWATTRRSIDDDWGPAVQLGFNNPPGNFFGPSLSPDGSTVYFEATSAWGGYGNNDILQVKFIPICDFNSDEMVDIDDLVILIEHWGEEERLCDIGPLPLGDGMVDEADVKVLMSHWGQEAYDPALIAYWKLDEPAGTIACDSAGNCDGAVDGDPVWEPAGGHIGGALRCDGVDDYIATSSILNPGDGPFSVFAWVQGGGPGQVILSQDLGSDWLAIDPESGSLTTNIAAPKSRKPTGPLISDAVITDGLWHRIALVWDGASRNLYVDDALVATDEQEGLVPCSGGLHLGCGSDMAPGTFFCGLIDDVRIYNRAVQP